ncbi:flagellar basal body P-ring protein FlgI [Escherichia coli]|nr:flagellar basal body P-ring protein FlgI [Escherichia coli]EIH2294956.1 flagellar basal body P-ring protein FlgI [Escherichia coli]EIH3423029.1 flagellar basal body P-ring protein FlgI [Escherichia coli]EIH9775975.1 flagellar basal body P-ring protein FlgI [Escherichia coli]
MTADRRAYRVGDILTVILEESTQSSKQAKTNFGKSNTVDIGAPTIFSHTKDKLSGSIDANRDFDGSATSQQQNSLRGEITVSVHAVQPNGILEIRGEKWLTLNLKRPSFKDANNIAAAINASFGGIATAQSSTNVTVRAPTSPGARVAFMSQLDDVQVQAEKIRARVVFNSRTGTVVMGDGVALHAAAVSHGSLTVSINETSNVSQPNAFAGGRTAVTPQSNIAVNHARPGVVSLPESSSLKTLVNALNSLGATPDDIMSILQALHEAGALDADLEVI